MIRYLLFFLFCGKFLFAEEPITLQSQEVAYDGKQIVLSGDVTIEHPFGIVSAKRISMNPDQIEGKGRFSELCMSDQVNIKFVKGGELSCSTANLNFHLLKGHFIGDKNEKVIYSEQIGGKGKNDSRIPIKISCQEMNIELNEDQFQKNPRSPSQTLASIHAKKQVVVSYNDYFFVNADCAIFQRQNSSNHAEQLPGVIVLKNEEQDKNCKISSVGGDEILSPYISIDTIKRYIQAAKPTGTIFINKEKNLNKENGISFSGNKLTWDDRSNTMSIQDNVHIKHPWFGTLDAQDKIFFIYETNENTKQLAKIETLGEIFFTYLDASGASHHLACLGSACIDNKRLTASMEGLKNSFGAISEEHQLCFQDPMGEIHADRLEIHYTLANGKVTPSKITLEGHVRMINHGAMDPEKTKSFLEYALAEKVEYLPEAKEVMLSSSGKGRVLFFDKINQLEVSAPSLRIRRDQATNKEFVQGIGDVRFSFIEKEKKQLQQYFKQSI